MVSSTFLTRALVVSGLSIVIAGPCRPSSQISISSELLISTSTFLESLPIATSTSEASTTGSFPAEETTATSFASSMSLVTETLLDTSAVSDYTVTETGTTTAAAAETTSQDTTEVTTSTGSETTAEAITRTTTDIAESMTITMSETTADGTTTITESSLPPVPTTYKMVARSESVGDLVMYANGHQMLVSTSPFSATWTSSISYDEETAHLVMGGTAVCVMYDPANYLAALGPCPSVVDGQYRHLTCEPPSDAGLVCNIRAMTCGNSGCTELQGVWNQFYLLGWDEGVWLIIIGADDLSQEDFQHQGLEPISMGIETV